MRVKEYQLDELARARALQDEAAKLHIPVPVLSYQYEIADADGNIEEKGIGKSNSYTRNALNMLAWHVGFCNYNINTGAFADGSISMKDWEGKVWIKIPQRRETNPSVLVLGTSAAAESLDSYTLPSSELTSITSQISSVFNSTTRKLITTHSRTYKNKTGSTINIVESGMCVEFMYASHYALVIRDVFAPIPVEPGKSITWTYVTEVAYPEP